MRNFKRNLLGGAMAAVTLASSVMPAFAAGNVTMGQDNKGNGDTTVTGTVSPINTMDVTVDITGIKENTCLELSSDGATKATYVNVDCE